MLILIPTLVFLVSNLKPILGQVWDKKVKASLFCLKIEIETHYLEDSDSYFDISFSNFKPKSRDADFYSEISFLKFQT